MASEQELGKKGEALCADFLHLKGYEILERNIKSPFGEVDIICERQGCLWAVEVKTRRSINAVWMSGIISRYQIQRIANALEWYAREQRCLYYDSLALYLAVVDIMRKKIQMIQLFRTE